MIRIHKKRELSKLLQYMIGLLDKEKQALLNNKGDKVQDIVFKKNTCIEQLSDFKGIDVNDDQEIIALVGDINLKQELNLLLTKQAMSFQEVMLSSIAENVSKLSKTYSSSGNYESEDNINFINQEV